MLDFLRYIPLAQAEPGGPTSPPGGGGGGGGGGSFAIDLPIDLGSVAAATALVGATMLLLVGTFYISFMLSRRAIRRIGAGVGGDDVPPRRVSWAMAYLGDGRSPIKRRVARSILVRAGYDPYDFEIGD